MYTDAGLESARQKLFHHLRQDVGDERVAAAMERVPRQAFVPYSLRHMAYEDIPLPIGDSQTISQPFIVALMTSALDLREDDRVLELGTGSGYQSAILSLLVPKGSVLSLEKVPRLAHEARGLLQALGYSNVEVRTAGPHLGAPKDAPFDAILVTAGAPRLPESLAAQLVVGGRMVIPVGPMQEQDLLKILRTDTGYRTQSLGPCRFVPLLGEDAWPA